MNQPLLRVYLGFLLIILLAPRVAAGGNTLMVPETFSLSDAVFTAGDGDTISIAAGTQTLDASVVISANNLTIEGRTGIPGDVIIRTVSRETGVFSATGILNLTIRDLSVNDSGLALQIRNSTDVLISNCGVNRNLGSITGPCLIQDSNAVVEDCTFTENFGLFGGALIGLEADGLPSELAITRSSFSHNSATLGGAIGFIGNPNSPPNPSPEDFWRISIHDSIIENNTAEQAGNLQGFGGGVLLSGGFRLPVSATVSNTTIRSCTAMGGGGGMAVMLNRGILDFVRIRDSTFEANIASASHGGGLLFFDGIESPDAIYKNSHTFFVEDNYFVDNRAELNGGGVAVIPADHFPGYVVQGNVFQSNEASAGGGACFAANPNRPHRHTLIANEFRGNVADRLRTSDNVGGGLCLVGTEAVARANSFYGNIAGKGGGLAMVGDGSLMDANVFGDPFTVGNDADFGAGVYIGFEPIFGDRVPKLTNNHITDNRAFKSGGALFVETKFGIPNERALIANNYIHRNFLSQFGNPNGVGEAALFEGQMGDGVAFVHNTIIDHATRGDYFQKGDTPPPASIIHLGNQAEPLIANNLIANTSPQEISGIYEEGLLAPRVLNNAFFNVSTVYTDDGFDPLSVVDLNDLGAAEGNLAGDPMLEPSVGSFGRRFRNPHLAAGSPLIGAATDLSGLPADFLELLTEDFETIFNGVADMRPFGEGSDIGGDERGPEPTATPTPTFTATEEPTETSTPTPVDCDVAEGSNPELNPRCDMFDLLILIENQRGQETGVDTDFDGQDGDDFKDVFLFSTEWYN